MARRYLRYATCKTPVCDVYGQFRIPNLKKKIAIKRRRTDIIVNENQHSYYSYDQCNVVCH